MGINTVREAVQGLVAMGLVESRPGKGTWVRPDAMETLFSPTMVKARLGSLDAKMVYETRSVIEVGLTEFAAERATIEEIERIWDALKAMRTSVDDVDGFLRADLEFHLAVAEASHNDLLCQFYYLSRKLVSEVIAQLVQVPLVREDSVNIQRDIARAIADHDPVQARLAAITHMRYISP